MKKFLIVLLSIFSIVSYSQDILEPVKWEVSKNILSDNEVDVIFKATIDDGWKVYSQSIELEGLSPTYFEYNNKESIEPIGLALEPDPIIEFDSVWNQEVKYFKNEVSFVQRVKILDQTSPSITGQILYITCDEIQCVSPFPLEFSINLSDESTPNIDESTPNTSNNDSGSKDKGLLALFLIAFGSGFIALLTPCVFPMIPMTVSFFTKQSKTRQEGIRNAIIYGISIIVIYVALGVGVSAIFGAEAMNDLATNIYFNIAFFLLLIVFGLSFLGAFDLSLPSSWVNKVDKASDVGGLIGIFFMAFTLALVSFSCTGPIVGTLLVEAATGSSGFMGPIVGMIGFSLAIALPFAIFAAFPGWLNSMPQSGGWLNSVKVVLGFLEIALAFKFLSNADLVMDTHYFEREMFIAVWVMTFGLLTMYLLGFLKLPHDSELKYISVSRVSIAIITGTFTIYLIPGLWGAPLKLVSAFPPPLEYSESPYGVGYRLLSPQTKVEGQHLGPQGIMAFHDYELGLEYAKEVNKPVFIDFTGKACVNCRKMEQSVWSDLEIKDILQNKVVLISLYVDSRKKLDKPYYTDVLGENRKIKTDGDKWKAFQINTYGTSTQPYYVLLDPNSESILTSNNANYDTHGNVSKFRSWLKEGLTSFENK